MEKEKFKWEAILFLFLGFVILIIGIYFLLEDLVIIGYHRDFSFNPVGGFIIIFLGLITLVIAYNSLSPFGKIRSFIEGRIKRKIKER